MRRRRMIGPVRRAIRRTVRHRAFLLSLAILPQVLALTVLVGIFWMVRVREVLIAPAIVTRIDDYEVVRCRVSPGDVEKIPRGTKAEVELLDVADAVQAFGEGIVGPPQRERGCLSVDIAGPGLSEVLRKAKLSESSRVRVSVRTRRALTVILGSRAASGATEAPKVRR